MGHSIFTQIKTVIYSRFFSKKGSITVWVAILLSACFGLQSTFSYLLGKQIFEHVLLKTSNSYTSYALSRYHYPLKERFALMALVDLPDTLYFQKQMKNFESPTFFKRPPVHFSQELVSPMAEHSDLLLKQIKYITTLRLGAKWMTLFNHQEKALKVYHEAGETIKPHLEEAKESLDELERVSEYEDLEKEKDEEKEKEKSAFKAILLEALNTIKMKTASALLEQSEENSQTNLSSFFIKSFEYLSRIEKYYADFHVKNQRILNQFLILNYVLNSFSFQTALLGKESAEGFYQVLFSGQDRKAFQSNEFYQVEQILTGYDSEKAFKQIKLYIFILRFVVQFMALYHSEKYGNYLFWAELISKAVLVLSLGYVYIPPDSIALIFVAIDSLFLAQEDVDRLVKGEGVALWPQKYEQKTYYSHYLFLFGFLVSEKILLQRITEQIQKEMNEEYALGVKTEVSYEHFTQKYHYSVEHNLFE